MGFLTASEDDPWHSNVKMDFKCRAHIGDAAQVVCKMSVGSGQVLVAPVVIQNQVNHDELHPDCCNARIESSNA